MKAALLSALLFPGSGHFFLKKPVQGALLALISTICLYFLLITSFDIVQDINLKLQSGQIPLDIEKIQAMVSLEISSEDAQKSEFSSLILGICWLIGIVDSFRLGRLNTKSST
jgi:hypothetical protein